MWVRTFLKCFVLVVSLNTVQTAVIGRQGPKNGWNYDDPNQWPIDYPTCGGERQSPIDLDVATAIETEYPTLSFGNYNKVISVESLTNNGHTIMLQFPDAPIDEVPFIEGGGLTDRYNFHQLHFHWGSDLSRGSEHRFSGQTFPGELHIVHYNVKYSDFTTASGYPDGIAVLAVMIEMETRDNIAFRHLQYFENIILPDSPATDVPIPFPLEDLLPDNTSSFFRYDGSLTTPECNESVIWTVFQTPIAISERQLQEFSHVQDPENRPLADNFRPVQLLNNRVVTYRI